jgi:hypothetical protein
VEVRTKLRALQAQLDAMTLLHEIRQRQHRLVAIADTGAKAMRSRLNL